MTRVVRRRLTIRQAVVLSVIAVVLGLGLLIGFSYLASEGTIDVNLGDREFNAGRADAQAESIERGGPVPFRDAAGGTRDIWLQHLGADDETGWYAIAARVSEDCLVAWLPAEEAFADQCSGTRYPPDGEGLTRYVVRVDGGRVYVDLRATLPDADDGEG